MNVGSYPWFWPLLAGLAIMLAGLALWLLTLSQGKLRQANVRRRFADAFKTSNRRSDAGEVGLLEAMGNRIVRRKKNLASDEVTLLLARAGWRRRSDLSVFFAIQSLLPIVAGIIASQVFFIGGISHKDWAILFLVCTSAWLLPKRIVAYRAAVRQKRIAAQTPVLVHLLRTLLGTGLSVEQSMRSLAKDTQDLLPDLAAELNYLISHIDAGEDVTITLRNIAQTLEVPAFTDLAMVLEQTYRMGGSVQRSLTNLSALIEDRMLTDLKEKVSKLSGKMTVVMMLFMFPALLVFLAAPGFLAIVRGLKGALG